MMVIVSYDVSTQDAEGRRRLRKVGKACQKVGQRVQNSVFECTLDPEQLVALRHTLRAIMDEETDSLRFYLLGKEWKRRVEHWGAKPSLDLDGPLIV